MALHRILKRISTFGSRRGKTTVVICGILISVLVMNDYRLLQTVWDGKIYHNLTTLPNRTFPQKSYAEVWDEVESLVGNDSLYPESYDVNDVLNALRNAKIVHADMFLVTSAYKWMFTLEGGQKVIFKPEIVPRSRRFEHCFTFHCEHAEYEITAFTLNRLLGLRNMPYTTGRILSWWDDILPVATPNLRGQFKNISKDGKTICAETRCNLEKDSILFCFEGGIVPGAMMYFLHREVNIFTAAGYPFYNYKIAELKGKHKHRNESLRNLDRLPGDDTFCKVFRANKLYKYDSFFADITDISVLDYLLSHSDSTHTYINTTNGEIMNVMIDFGRSFCKYPEQLRIVAPITQCCKVRKRVFENLVKYRHNLLEMFDKLTQSDPLYPLLQPDLQDIVQRRHTQLLSLIDYCFALKSIDDVLMDV